MFFLKVQRLIEDQGGSNGHEVGLRRAIYWPFDDEVNYQMKLQENLSKLTS